MLSEKWAASPAAYLATTVPDVPNAYVLLGPNILVYKSFLALAEAQLDYAVDALVTTERAGIEVIEIRDEPFRIFNEEVQAGLAPTVLDNGGCSSLLPQRPPEKLCRVAVFDGLASPSAVPLRSPELPRSACCGLADIPAVATSA